MKLHLGCGHRDFGTEWIHIDGGNFPHVVSHDVRSLPYPDHVADVIYASHLLEYFDREEGEEILREWNRVIRRGGILRLAVPDFGKLAYLYLEKGVSLDNIIGPLYGKMGLGDQVIYHKTVYNYSSLRELLLKCGFRDTYTYSWRETDHSNHDDHSQAYIPHMDKENGTLISLNVEAIA